MNWREEEEEREVVVTVELTEVVGVGLTVAYGERDRFLIWKFILITLSAVVNGA